MKRQQLPRKIRSLQINSRQLTHGNYQRGFTLVELLAVIAILGVVGSMMFGVLFATLRGANKSDSVTTIQQNGNVALGQMVKMIRFSSILEDPTSCYTGTSTPVVTTAVTIRNLDNGSTTFSCSGVPDGTIASNGASLIDQSSVAVTACSFSCLQVNQSDVPTMTVSFTLNKKNSNGLVENTSPIIFQTSVSLRNIN